MTRALRDLLEAIQEERRIERRAKDRPWLDEVFWGSYIYAVERRRKAADAYFKGAAEGTVEMVEMGL
jgi:hypothetical protein